MFTLTSVEEKLQLTKRRCGLFVVKSIIAGIYQNDEVVEIMLQ